MYNILYDIENFNKKKDPKLGLNYRRRYSTMNWYENERAVKTRLSRNLKKFKIKHRLRNNVQGGNTKRGFPDITLIYKCGEVGCTVYMEAKKFTGVPSPLQESVIFDLADMDQAAGILRPFIYYSSTKKGKDKVLLKKKYRLSLIAYTLTHNANSVDYDIKEFNLDTVEGFEELEKFANRKAKYNE